MPPVGGGDAGLDPGAAPLGLGCTTEGDLERQSQGQWGHLEFQCQGFLR
ncbi:MAG: hypothetical protein HC929_09135 [Leptolyngbyaceae cyanobacterium SM2_5_2]|nr:hypothetical protein [Leptolyngbyaceae cyanobacterium SM2_5_2]